LKITDTFEFPQPVLGEISADKARGFNGGECTVEVFWIVTLCNVVVGYQRCGGSRCIHLQGDRGSKVLWSVVILP